MANLFGKYKIEKADGSPVDANAMYFVLRIDTDVHARVALRAYARSIKYTDPVFANELDEWIESRPAPYALDASGCTCGSKDDHHTVACYLGKDERQ